MMTGHVASLHILIPLTIAGATAQGTADFLLDTGFAGFLTLPPEVISRLGLLHVGIQPSTLADGSQDLLDIYRVTIFWHGAARELDVLEIAGIPLMGMALLNGNDLHVEVEEGGTVTVQLKDIRESA